MMILDKAFARMMEGILAMEEEHADDLVGLLEDLKAWRREALREMPAPWARCPRARLRDRPS